MIFKDVFKLNLFKNSVLSITLACLATSSFANQNVIGGISLGSTRIIYPMDAKQVSLAIVNSNLKERFLINSWIEATDEKKSKDFLITPPLFVAEANTENTLRIVSLATNLPQDRESVFGSMSKLFLQLIKRIWLIKIFCSLQFYLESSCLSAPII